METGMCGEILVKMRDVNCSENPFSRAYANRE